MKKENMPDNTHFKVGEQLISEFRNSISIEFQEIIEKLKASQPDLLELPKMQQFLNGLLIIEKAKGEMVSRLFAKCNFQQPE